MKNNLDRVLSCENPIEIFQILRLNFFVHLHLISIHEESMTSPILLNDFKNVPKQNICDKYDTVKNGFLTSA